MSKRERVKAGIGNAISNTANMALLSLGAKDEEPERAEEVVVTKEMIKDFDAEGFARAVVGINRSETSSFAEHHSAATIGCPFALILIHVVREDG